MSQTKTAITNMLFLFLRMIVTMGISLYSSRIILEALGVVDYGIYNIIGEMVALFSFLHYSLNGRLLVLRMMYEKKYGYEVHKKS